MTNDDVPPGGRHADSEDDGREPGIALRYKIMAYGQFPASAFVPVHAIITSGAALLAWLRGHGLPVLMNLSESTGTVTIENEPQVTGRIANLIVDVSGFSTWQTTQYVFAHGIRVLAAAALIVCAFILLRRFLRLEIFSEPNTTIVTWVAAALSTLAVSSMLLDKLSGTATTAVFGNETSLYDSGLGASYAWLMIAGSTALVLVFRRGQELQETVNPPQAPETD